MARGGIKLPKGNDKSWKEEGKFGGERKANRVREAPIWPERSLFYTGWRSK